MKFSRWLFVAAGAVIGCIASGAVFSLAAFLSAMPPDTGWSRTEISAAMTVNFVAMGLTGFGWGAAQDRFGLGPVLLSGSALLGAGLLLASRATNVLEFQLCFGMLAGAGGGAIFTPLIAAVAMRFDTHRSLAVSLVSAGIGVAPMSVVPVGAWLVSIFGWRTAQASIGLAVLGSILPACLFLQRAQIGGYGGWDSDTAGPTIGIVRALRSSRFVVLALTYFCCCATHSGPVFHIVSHAMSCGVPLTAAVSISSVAGLAGLSGRILFGLLGDRFGAKPVLSAGLVVQATAAGCYVFARDPADFYAIAAVFGLAYAGSMPLYTVLARENFPAPILGTVMGASNVTSCLGMALGPLAGGLIFDSYASYSWLFVGSFGIGLCAAMILVLFRPAGRAQEADARRLAGRSPASADDAGRYAAA